jgi:actin-related protein
MPDGSNINIPNYIFHEAPEVLFQPNMLGYNILNIPQAIINCLQGIDKYYWSDLLSHIVISGGNSSYSGFEERLRTELKKLVPQLGKIPKPKVELSAENRKLKMQSIEVSKKQKDTCSNCGVLVDLSDGKEFCPSCGGRVKLPELTIGAGSPKKKPFLIDGKISCPYCKKAIGDISSAFCPYCGKNISTQKDIPEIPEEIIKKAPPAREFAGFYESSDEIIRFFVPDNLQFAIFNGAAILGSLPSFQSLFVSKDQFETNKDLLYRSISEIF